MRILLLAMNPETKTTAPSVHTPMTEAIEALKFMKAMFQESQTPEVFTWSSVSNNQAMLAGRASYVLNAISITRQSEREHLPTGGRSMICGALKGPLRCMAAPHVTDCYVIWDFAKNKAGAQQFLIDYMNAFHDAFVAGQFYNFPCFPATCPGLKKEIVNDPRANPPDKYIVLSNALDWTTNVGYPGYATSAIAEAFTLGPFQLCLPRPCATMRPRRTQPRRPRRSTNASSPSGRKTTCR